jgi:hypothetical protein
VDLVGTPYRSLDFLETSVCMFIKPQNQSDRGIVKIFFSSTVGNFAISILAPSHSTPAPTYTRVMGNRLDGRLAFLQPAC